MGGRATGEARKLAGIGVVYGRNEVESLRPDASLTMSSVRLLASLPDARTHRQHPSNAAQESATPLTMRFKMQSDGEPASPPPPFAPSPRHRLICTGRFGANLTWLPPRS